MDFKHFRTVRRALVALILLVILAVLFNYIQTWRTRAGIVQRAAKILSSEMLRSADSIEYSVNENGRLKFRVRAERLLETRQGKSLLEGIEAFDFDTDGTVRNHIRSQRAEYDRNAGTALFSGDVRLSMGSSAELQTSALFYDLASEKGRSEDRIRLQAPRIEGTARGAHYDHASKVLDLEGDIDFTVKREVPASGGRPRDESLRITSREAHYYESEQRIHFLENARLSSESAELAGREIEGRFTPEMSRLSTLVCRGDATYVSREDSALRTLRGERISFRLGEQTGNLEGLEVEGNAVLENRDEETQYDLRGSRIRMEMDGVSSAPRRILSETNVTFSLIRPARETSLSGQSLEAAFDSGAATLQAVRVEGEARLRSREVQGGSEETLSAEEIHLKFKESAGRNNLSELEAIRAVRWQSNGGGGSESRRGKRTLTSSALHLRYAEGGEFLDSGYASGGVTIAGIGSGERATVRSLEADRVRFSFFPAGGNRLRHFEGTEKVRVHYSEASGGSGEAGGREFRTVSDHMRAEFRAGDGEVESVSQWGNLRYEEQDRTAVAGRGQYRAETDTLVLTESPRITDSNGTTTGTVVRYDRSRQVLSVDGSVRSVLRGKSDGDEGILTRSGSNASPSVVTADVMEYWIDESRALYTGRVHLLAESSQLQTRWLEIRDSGNSVEARGEVAHLVYRQESGGGDKPERTRADRRGTGSPILVRSETLNYLKSERSIHYAGGVSLRSDDIHMASESLDGAFDTDGKELERATALGRIRIRQGEREARGDRAEYHLKPGKFEVAGNVAEITDPVRGKSFARRLTFFTADDRILLENR